MQQQRSEGELQPEVFGDHHHQEFAAGFQDPRCLAESRRDCVAAQVIDGVSAYDGVEGGRLKRELAHVAGLNCGALVHAGSFQI